MDRTSPGEPGASFGSDSSAGLRRSIALVLQRVGFDSATPEALESFAFATETYLNAFVTELNRSSVAARREHPTPVDFESALRTFNLPIASLKPHLRPPVPRRLRQPDYIESPGTSDHLVTLPFLCEELSGRSDKFSKTYIPTPFPDFPSIHTYRYTPHHPPEDRNPHRIREEAAKAAKQGEDALRKLVRAAKIRKQKEVRSVAGRDPHSRERYRLWEAAMQGLLEKKYGGRSVDEIADHSMIVNADGSYQRREAARGAKRLAGANGLAAGPERPAPRAGGM